MLFVGADLHKHTITMAVVDSARKPLYRRRFSNTDTSGMADFLPCELTVGATASYEWFVACAKPGAKPGKDIMSKMPFEQRVASRTGPSIFGTGFRPRTIWTVIVLLAAAFSVVRERSAGTAEPPGAVRSPTEKFFDSGTIPELRLILSEEKQNSLRERPREYVRCILRENGTVTYSSIGVKLKGAAGSYRDFDDLPGLTLNMDKYKKGQTFHGMEKFHLNNSVQDPSLLSEWVGSELFREAGYPCPRVGHARVYLNDRDLGVYVVREGFDAPFLRRAFKNSDGNLYDGGFVQDIDRELEMDQGDDPDDRSDLLGLAVACHEIDPSVRWQSIAERIDLKLFLKFMALERMCGHWDGYTLNMNNYRLFFPAGGRGVFLPHGMDQLFGDPGAGLFDHAAPLLAAAVMQNDSWRRAYQTQLMELRPVFQSREPLLRRMGQAQDRIRVVLESIDPERAQAHREHVEGLQTRLTERASQMEDLIRNGEPQPVEIDETGTLLLTDWSPNPDGEGTVLEEAELEDVACLRIARDRFGDHSSSWRCRLLLPRGRYRFEARVKTQDVIPTADQGRGAGIRESGQGRPAGLTGTVNWQPVQSEIEIREDQRSIELVLELRARLGTAWFDRASLQLQRLNENRP